MVTIEISFNSILRFSKRYLQMSLCHGQIGVCPLHVLRPCLVKLKIEAPQQMREREIQLTVCEAVIVSI